MTFLMQAGPTTPPRARGEDVPGASAACDDAALVSDVAAGDRAAFEALYLRHRTPLYRTAVAMTRDQATAEELLQEAFLRAYRHMARVELAPGGSLRPWLHRILINLIYDWSARQRHAPSPLDTVAERFITAPALSPESESERRELQRVVGEAIRALPFKQRIVVVLFYVHDMDLEEIAEVINVPPGTVKSRLFYARARLRGQLEADVRLSRPVAVGYAAT
jgi:RNA polymerase sigma-70 factor, ECF subfamily